MGAGRCRLVMWDVVISMMWIWSGCLIKMFVKGVLGLRVGDLKFEVVKAFLYIISMYFFAVLAKLTNGGSYNPLTVLYSAVSGGFSRFFFTVAARIPAQVIGSIVGVKLIIRAFPEIGLGPRLNVDLHQGALTEGLLTFAIITISLALARNIPGSFYRKTWISSVSKLVLQILGSDLTGGCMNPASVMGWAYARGDYITKEHLLVYWLAPVEATLLAVWTFKLLVRPMVEDGKGKVKGKSD